MGRKIVREIKNNWRELNTEFRNAVLENVMMGQYRQDLGVLIL